MALSVQLPGSTTCYEEDYVILIEDNLAADYGRLPKTCAAKTLYLGTLHRQGYLGTASGNKLDQTHIKNHNLLPQHFNTLMQYQLLLCNHKPPLFPIPPHSLKMYHCHVNEASGKSFNG